MPVLELGMGEGSTPYLHDYCEDRGRGLLSVDGDIEWVRRFASLSSSSHAIVCAGRDWGGFPHVTENRFSVALVDHAPSDRRQQDVEYLVERCAILVLHDTEGHDYDGVWRHFPYRVDVKTRGAWASAVSKMIDVTTWRGQVVGGWAVS